MYRFTKTEKWEDEWFSDLDKDLKLVFLFLTDKCDNAGFFELNPRLHPIMLKMTKEEYLGAIKGLNEKVVLSKSGRKIWLVNFLEHQKNLPLNPQNNAHKQILQIINSNVSEFNYSFDYLGANQGLISPLGNGIGIVNNNRTVFSDFKMLEEAMTNQQTALEAICKKQKRKMPDVLSAIPEFITHLSAQGEEVKVLKDAMSHFDNWLQKRPTATAGEYPYQKYGKKK